MELAKEVFNKLKVNDYGFGHNYISSEVLLYAILDDQQNLIYDFLIVEGIKVKELLDHLYVIITSYENEKTYEKDMEVLYNLVYINDETSISELFFTLFDERLLSGKVLKMLGLPTKYLYDSYLMTYSNISNYISNEREKMMSGGIDKKIVKLDFLTTIKKDNTIGFIGREEEIKLCQQTLLRKIKKNILLVGGAGVGKSKVVEELSEKLNDPIYKLDMTRLMSDIKYRGELEEKIDYMLKFFQVNPNYILFIDEAHMITGGNNENDVSLINTLKEPLARGEFRVILATTTDEFNRFFKKDKAFLRRLNIINIKSTDKNTTVNILWNFCKKNEIKTSKNNLRYIYDLTINNFPNSNMPDKAIEVLDATFAKVMFNKIHGKGAMDIEKERDYIIQTGNYDKAIDFKTNLRKNTVTKNNIKEVFTENYGITVKQVTVAEVKKIYKNITDELIGQNKPIQNILTKYYSISEEKERPFNIFLLGTPGVGKTMFFRKLSEEVSNGGLLKINCADFQTKHAIDQLIGSPPGYVGYDEGGSLTNFIQDNPQGLILFDEIEKADKSLFNYLLPLLEDGKISDRKGNEYTFKNGIIGFTSNIKSNNNISYMKQKNTPDISAYFSKEFIDRLDIIQKFNHLSYEDYLEVYNLYDTNKKITDYENIVSNAYKNSISVRSFIKIIKNRISVLKLKKIKF